MAWNPSDADERAQRSHRHEQRLENREAEAIAAEVASAQRTLVDVGVDFGMAGHRLLVEVGPHRFQGWIRHAGDSVISLEQPNGVLVRIAVAHIVAMRPLGGERGSARVDRGHPRTMAAVVREFVVTEEPVTVARTFGDHVAGRVTTASDDHVVIEAVEGSWVIAQTAVVALF